MKLLKMEQMNALRLALLLIVLSFFVSSKLSAQDGALDLSFNSVGTVTTSFGSAYDNGRSLAIQSDGKIVVAGNTDNGSNYDFAVVRYNSDGTLDTSFGTGGKVTTSVGNFSDDAYGVALQSDGKIVVAGVTSNGNSNDVAVVRYNNDGTLDTGFGTGGKVVTAINTNDDDTAFGIAIQSDGKIVVAGMARLNGSSGGNYDFLIIRYNTNGTLDASFDTDGIVTTDFSSAYDAGNSIAIQSDGKIVVGGYSGTNRDFALARYNTNGSLDTGFGTGGKTTTAIGSSNDVGKSVVIQSDGKIVLGGYARIGITDDFALIRYNNNGSIDNSFGSGGKVTTAIGTGTDWGNSVVIQPDGKILLAGFAAIGFNNIAIVRYNIDGSIDNTFDSDGKVTTPIGPSGTTGSSIALQSDGKIVVAGSSYPSGSNADFVVVRYANTSTANTCINWNLLSSNAVTSTSGNISGQAQTIQGMTIFSNEPYTVNGQQLYMPFTGWTASSSEIATQYIEFNASPVTGNAFTVTNVSFNYGDVPLTNNFNILQAQVYYSTNNWTSPGTLLNTSPLVYLSTTMQSFSATGLNVQVGNGQTFSLRIYPYSPTGGLAMVRTFAVHNNVMICGTTETDNSTPGSICGMKFNDLNGNGLLDTGEQGLANWVINLAYEQATGIMTLTDTTNVSGYYCFNDLQPGGTYTVSEINQDGWQQTFPSTPGTHTVTLTSGQQIDTLNFGNKQLPTLGSICGIKFNDLDGDGVKDPGEPGLANWEINLTYNTVAGTVNLKDSTDDNGNYCFYNLQPGIFYHVSETNQIGWQQTLPAYTPATYNVTLANNHHIDYFHFGNHFIGSADSCIYLCNPDFEEIVNISAPSNYVQTSQDNIPCWNTMATDGKIEIWHSGYGTVPAYSGNFFAELNATQVGILYQTFSASTAPQSVVASFAHRGRYAGNDVMKVYIVAPDGVSTLLGTYTDNNTGWGYYSVPFTINTTGNWSLKFESVSSNNGTGPADGGNFLDAINVTCPSSVCGIKFNDINGDGQKQADEPVLPNWEITLSGTLNLTTETGSDGSYCFNNLTAGTYTVSEIQQEGWEQTYPDSSGSHTVILETGQNIDSINFGNHLSPVGSVCDSLKAEVLGSAVEDCCWSMSLTHPSNTSGITGIQFESLSPNSFVMGSSQLGSSYTSGWLYVSNTPAMFTIKRLSGNIPSGQLNNFFNFCLNKLSNPQQVVVNWLNANDSIVCSDTVLVNCEIPCVSIIDAEVLCDKGNYALNYAFTNNASFAINKIEVEQITPAGITVTPATISIPIIISGNTSAVQSFTISGAAPNTTITIVFKFTSADGCCSCTQTISVTTPSCMCEETDARLEQDPVNCCATLNLTNNYSGSYFTQINLTALTSGTTFSTWNTNTTSSWYSLNTFASNTVQLVNIGTGFIPSGNSNGILNFCLTGFNSTPQKILLEWMRNDTVQCVDTLITTCTPTVITNECVQLVDDSLTCLPDGSFQYKFKVRNNSSHTSTGFQLNPVSPAMVAYTPDNFSSISIAPGMTSAEQTLTINGVNSNELFCFEIALYEHIYQNGRLQYSWCCHSDTICIETPDCGPTGCVEPPSGMVGWWTADGHANDISGLNNHGTITANVGYVTGKVDQTFNVNNYGLITVPSHPSLNFGTGNFTIDSWVKTNDSLHSFNITQKAYAQLNTNGFYIVGYALFISEGKLKFLMGDGNNILTSHDTSLKIADDVWHLVAVTIDRTSNTGGKLYVDGNVVLTFDATAVPNSISNNEDLILFNESNYYDQTGNQIDELEIFNRELSESEIKSIFTAGSEGKCKASEELGSICGMKFNDLNGNGRKDDKEPGIPEWTITLDGTLEITATTDKEGNFCFVNLPAGEYKINELMQSGWVQTSPSAGNYVVDLAPGQNITGVNFGNKVEKDDRPGSICGMKFNDIDGNGKKDVREPGLGNWTIVLTGAVEMTVTTDKDGSFCFVDLPAGDYTIKEIMQEGWIQTLPASGNYTFNLAAGQNITGIDFGNKVEKDDKLGSICGIKFNDLNGNGKQDEGEPVLPDWTINLDGKIEMSMRTDKEGNFCFNNLPEGEYKISETLQNGWVQTLPSAGYYVINLSAGQHLTNIDFGNKVDKDEKLGSICGMKFNDLNGNGKQDEGEPGIAEWQINIGGTEDHTVFTDREGRFCLYGLRAGEYKIGEEMRTGWIQTAPSSGNYVVMLSSGQNLTEINFGNRRRIRLKEPVDGAFIKEGSVLIFSWEPYEPTPSSYKIKIVEIIGDQSPEQAFKTNKPHFEKDSIETETFQYPSTGPSFKNNGNYAWVIWINEGTDFLSEAWMFRIEGHLGSSITVSLQQPPANQLNAEDLWIASLDNTTENNLEVYLLGSLSEAKQGNVFETKSGLKTLKPGTTMVYSTDFDTEMVNTIFDRWGNLIFGSGDYTSCLRVENPSGEELGSGCIVQKVDIKSSVNELHQANQFQLMQSYPNPFAHTATIEYYLPKASFITISVYNIYGKEIEVLVNEEKSPGHYKINFDGKHLPSGVYFYTLKTSSFIQSKKMIRMD